jgi:ubiquitin-conjugating enzyme E2 O
LWQKVHYHAGGLRLNPNLYEKGKVCLSLLNTWSGRKNEKWTPGVSTMLQVLVSIQGLILNAKPYFNEPGYANKSGTQNGEARSLKYNKNTFILSVRTMMYKIKKPPKVCFCSWFISLVLLLVYFSIYKKVFLI